MVGILGKMKGIFGKKQESNEEPARRIESKRLTEQIGDVEFVPRYKLAKKMREDKDMDTPIVKRKRY